MTDCKVILFKRWFSVAEAKAVTVKDAEFEIKIADKHVPKDFDERVLRASIENRDVNQEFYDEFSYSTVSDLQDQVKSQLKMRFQDKQEPHPWADSLLVLLFENGTFVKLDITGNAFVYRKDVGRVSDLPKVTCLHKLNH